MLDQDPAKLASSQIKGDESCGRNERCSNDDDDDDGGDYDDDDNDNEDDDDDDGNENFSRTKLDLNG